MSLDDGVNSSFYISILTLLCGSIGLAIRYCYRSKCKECECCGFKIKRDTEIEKEEDMMTPNIVSNKSQSIDGNETMSRV